MFEFLKTIDQKIYNRYLTVEKNIESKSNSFYDSWLDLAEHFSKHVAKVEGITIDATFNTMIGILAQKEYKNFYFSLGMNKFDYQDLFDLAKGVNAHKHNIENKVALSDVIKYLKAFHDYAGLFFAHINGEICEMFSEDFYSDLYGKADRDKSKLIKEKEKLIESLSNLVEGKEILAKDLARVKAIAKRKENYADSLEEEKELLLEEINELKDIKLTTMEEKMSRIVSILERQTYALEKVSDQLEYATEINFGQSFGNQVIVGDVYAPARYLNGYDRYIAIKIFKKKNEEKFIKFLRENEGKRFSNEKDNNISFRYKLKKNDVHFVCQNSRIKSKEEFDLSLPIMLFKLRENLVNSSTIKSIVLYTLGKAAGCYPIKYREDELVDLFFNR